MTAALFVDDTVLTVDGFDLYATGWAAALDFTALDIPPNGPVPLHRGACQLALYGFDAEVCGCQKRKGGLR
ncbi:hypothetical protein QMK19_03210 [Streptomyces sp. H10-C2]|uniref:hypothetical protein n=1 Tax=unclassified Streptomyces TaxID=2593676 RepID=UPI0024BBAC76|nr:MULTISPECIES: hypothetical protein [unclassified Streptomyces]MDJ0342194.1 hypothetical protein [Streptomyces sp. PH10-H1]MDJ0368708.1 hypothetical protein [Streptomyces sp. H10-C2]